MRAQKINLFIFRENRLIMFYNIKKGQKVVLYCEKTVGLINFTT